MRGVIKRYHAPGTEPGTLAPPVASAAGPVTLSLITYGADHCAEHHLADLDQVAEFIPEGAKAWLRIVGHDPRVLGELTARFGVHPLVLEDALNVGQHPKIEDFGEYVFVIVDLVRLKEEGVGCEEEQISLLLFEELLITIQERESGLFAPIEERLRGGRGRIRPAGLDYLAYALIDAAVDHYFPVLERLGEHVEEVEEALLDHGQRSDLEKLHEIKRDLLRLRKATWPLREMVAKLARGDTALIHEDTRIYLRDIYDHTVQVMDIVETYREITTSLVDLYLSSVSNRMNEVMKVLTVIATIFMPLSFLASLYGMNFNTERSPFNMPELNWYLGYPFALGVMAAAALGMLLMFRRRGWF